MALDFESSIASMSDLGLWFKINSNESMTMFDISEIIRLRWPYFRDNWEFIKDNYVQAIPTYNDPNQLKLHIDLFSEFISSQRVSTNSRNPFDNEDILLRFYTIFDSTLINSVNLTFEEQQIVDNKIDRINSFTRGDFLAIREQLQSERDTLADKANATDVDYNRVFDRSPQTGRVSLKNKDINKMYEIQESIKSVDFILANAFSLETSAIDPFALARQNANNSEIEIGEYSSGSLTKLNYGEDLQSLAKRTLGDPNKWIDIAIANGLKAPYIDEVGEKLNLISNASGNQINISGLDTSNNLNVDKLSVGHIVLLKSDVQTFPEQRSILNVTEVPISGELILELDGEPNLEKYKLSENAHIRIFKQGTINSSFFILIPSEDPIDDELKGDTPWFLKASDVTEKRQKIDMFLTDTGDLTFDPTGDFQLSYGLENAVQAVKLKMMVEAGELRQHPEHGLVPLAGSSNFSVAEIKDKLTESIVTNIEADERFATIDRLDIEYSNVLNENNAVAFGITLVVQLSGSGQLVPITFSVNV